MTPFRKRLTPATKRMAEDMLIRNMALRTIDSYTLRHSFATGLLEAGVDLMAISKLLGHSSFTTTMIYLHCRKQHLGSTPSPIDWLPARQCPRWIDPSLQQPDPQQLPEQKQQPKQPPKQTPEPQQD